MLKNKKVFTWGTLVEEAIVGGEVVIDSDELENDLGNLQTPATVALGFLFLRRGDV